MQAPCRVRLAILFLIINGLIINARAQSRPGQEPKSSPSPKVPLSGNKKTEQADADVVRVETDLVNTLFTALDKDRRFITTLRPEDIRVFEDNVPQQISLFERETDRPLSIALVIDTSESQRAVLNDEKRAALAFVDSVVRPDKDRVSIVSFTGATRLDQDLTNDLPRLKKAVDRIESKLSPENLRRLEAGEPELPVEEDPTGYTGVWDALWITISKILVNAPRRARRAIILLSDGDDTSSKVKKEEMLDLAVKSDVVIYSVGIRDRKFPYGSMDRKSLRKISENSGGRAFFPADDSELRLAFSQIESELRSQYAIAYSPTNKAHDGSYRQVKIEIGNSELRKQKLKLLYRQGYYARKE